MRKKLKIFDEVKTKKARRNKKLAQVSSVRHCLRLAWSNAPPPAGASGGSSSPAYVARDR